ncbi:response regulator transcription factor [Paraglaciecola chathamensis]|jgi:DNA-binding NarL/FixJ family response regulator|uniref:Glycerol metabolism activator n=3 Tax=Paraglaciecola chathamensis TaxID=368405 RepID=A0A8H9II31_9ALTE|nr:MULTISPECIES: response regulator transcription factor [Paraglaciecola]AEE22803.1 two component transcriptional regulator, LuxR family [Glaciecola sp. 4H-3-7+YE-5]MBN28223.1 DNA-binding response regulator [Alteromonadaceae bacterium]MBJ2138163.1 response regulator transcription factor [Paraglaciecola chathamensis]MBU3018474.1 response regulator transcription factor [Paraglaciecola agarilytica]MDO6558462.1 response regulator transcription factor [Paraglaciecola chathamensis]|tara:strand:- start:588 stop:1244 length:657 start_codon:yes stop_codon:yes gene_type:complete
MYKFLVADDHPLFREAIINTISSAFPGSSTYETEDIESTLELIKSNDEIDLILLDLNMPGMTGLNGLLDVRNECPTTPVVIVSAETEKQKILQTLSYGAVGFIAKSSSKKVIGEAIQSVFEGNVYLPPNIMRSQTVDNQTNECEISPEKISLLTRRELIVLKHLTKGEANKQIAYNLHISETTIKSHVSSILKKLGATNRVKVVVGCGDIDFNQYLKR